MRGVHAPGCRDGLLQDSLAKLSLQAVAGDQVNGTPEQMLEASLHVDHPEEAGGPGEPREEVPIASRTGLAAGERAERREGADSELSQLDTVLGQNAQDVVTPNAPLPPVGQPNPGLWYGYLDDLQRLVPRAVVHRSIVRQVGTQEASEQGAVVRYLEVEKLVHDDLAAERGWLP